MRREIIYLYIKKEDLCQKVIGNNSVNQYDIDSYHHANWQKVVIVSSIVDIIHHFLYFFQIGSNHV